MRPMPMFISLVLAVPRFVPRKLSVSISPARDTYSILAIRNFRRLLPARAQL